MNITPEPQEINQARGRRNKDEVIDIGRGDARLLEALPASLLTQFTA